MAMYSMHSAYQSVKKLDGHMSMISGADIDFEDITCSDADSFTTVNGTRKAWGDVCFICVLPSKMDMSIEKD